MSDAIPEIWVERVALGEATEEQTRAVEEALGDQFEARMAALRADDAAIRAEVPPGRVANEVARRLRAAERDAASTATPARWWIPAGALAAAAALVLLWVRSGDDDPEPDPMVAIADTTSVDDDGPEQVYLKGDARLVIERVDGSRRTALAADDTVTEGTRLQLSYLAADQAQGVIVSIDGRGESTLHFPSTVDASPALAAGGKTSLDHSYELDDAPKFERFFFVTAPEGTAIDVAAVVDAARSLATSADAVVDPLVLPQGWNQRSLVLRKP